MESVVNGDSEKPEIKIPEDGIEIAEELAENNVNDTQGVAVHKPKEEKKHRKNDAEARCEALEKEIFELKDRYLRLMAEYENYRKRSSKEKESLYTDAIADVVKEWLPVVDNIERAVSFSNNLSENSAEKVAEGVEMIYRQMLEMFEKIGIKEIDCDEGGRFDPEIHEAVMHIEDESFGEQCIAQVFQKGYRAGDRVIRHSVVKVAN